MSKGPPDTCTPSDVRQEPARSEPAQSEAGKAEHLVSALYAENADELTSYLRKMYGDGPPEPEDITQQAFARLASQEHLSAVNNLKAFLWRTARNLVLTERRNAATRSKYEYEVEQLFFAVRGNDFSPERVLEVKEQLSAINAVLRKMPERRRQALLWNRVEGLNVAAVARRLGITRAGAVKHIARAAADIDAALKQGPENSNGKR
ncbi:MAG: sigma-70 family RNA polymerase sigma factor [Pseudomonadota bacterium]